MTPAAYQKQWRLNNPGACGRHSAVYRAKYPGRCKASKQKWFGKNLFYFKTKHLWTKFRLTLDEWFQIWYAQGIACAACGDIFEDLTAAHVDHDHTKQKGDQGFVRGLLCGKCNRALGQANDSAKRLRQLLLYLEKHHA
jgi:hypothetical protein